MPTPQRILLLSASSGAGHVRAADALLRACAEFPGIEAEHVDALKYTTHLFRQMYSRAYLELVDHAPEVLGWLYDHFDRPWQHMRRRLALDRLDRKSTRLNSSHIQKSRMPSSA